MDEQGQIYVDYTGSGRYGSSQITGPRMTRDDFRPCIDSKATGAVRVSLGLASNFADAQAPVSFAASFIETR